MATLKTLSDYPFLHLLSTTDERIVSEVYKSIPSVLFTMNMLDDCARDIIIFLYSTSAINFRSLFANNKSKESAAKALDAEQLLIDLKIVKLNEGVVELSKVFRDSYNASIVQRHRNVTVFEKSTDSRKPRRVTELYHKGQERWDEILKYITTPRRTDISRVTQKVFEGLGFVNGNEKTGKGFQFLLHSKVSQIWIYMIAYLQHLKKTQPDEVATFIDIFASLVLLSPNMPTNVSKNSYFVKSVEDDRSEAPYKVINYSSKAASEFFFHMRDTGFIYIKRKKEALFYITPLLSLLQSTGSVSADADVPVSKTDGFLIIESNYRVYAYTNDPLHLSILNTFTEPDGAFADMSMAMVTRNAVRRALDLGITAAQIVTFMRANSHPLAVEKFGPIGCVPQTVIDQVELWENELKRVQYQPAVMYSRFHSRADYVAAVEMAKKNEILLFSSESSKQIVIKSDAHSAFRQWWCDSRRR